MVLLTRDGCLFLIATGDLLTIAAGYCHYFKMTKAIAYLRCSTEKQAEHGMSLEIQEFKVRAYAALYDIDLVAVIVDAGVSAKTLDRPGLQQALALLKAGTADAILVMKLDRLSRSVADLGVLVEKYFQKTALLSVTEQLDTRSAGGRLCLNLLASVSQWERETIGERTSHAMQVKKQKGERVGSIPFGFSLDVDGRSLREVNHEQQAIALARHLRGRGLPLRKIALQLEAAGHRSRNGTRLSAEQIRRLTVEPPMARPA